MRNPPAESANVIEIDYANNPDLQAIFAPKTAGESCRLTLDLQVIAKSPHSIRLGINKVMSEDYETEDIEPNEKEPIVMRLRRATKNESMGHRGPRGEVPQTATNSLGTISNV